MFVNYCKRSDDGFRTIIYDCAYRINDANSQLYMYLANFVVIVEFFHFMISVV